MLGLLTRLLGGAVAPLIDQVSAISARLLRKLALFVVAAVCMLVVVVALTFAFDLWIAMLAGPIAGALAVALLYFVVAATALAVAMRDGHSKKVAAEAASAPTPELDEQIDRFTSPLMRLLGQLGLRREQFAVLAGGTLAKKIGPIPLVGLAIVVGFLLGRTWKTWKAFISTETLASLISMAGLFGGMGAPTDDVGEI